MSTATQALSQEINPDGLYTKNKIATITGLNFTKIKNLLIASGYNPDLKEYKGADLSSNFFRAVELFEAGKTLEDIKIILNVATNGHHFVPDAEIYTPEEKAQIEGKRAQVIEAIAEQLAGDVFDLLAGEDENPDSLSQEIAAKAKAALDGRFGNIRSASKRILISLI